MSNNQIGYNKKTEKQKSINLEICRFGYQSLKL